MPYTIEDYKRELHREVLAELTAEERRQMLERLSPEERLAGLSAAEIEAYLKRLRKGSPSSRKRRTKPKP